MNQEETCVKKCKAILTALAVIFCAAMLAGCGTSYNSTTFVLNKDRSARQYIIEDADADTTITELKAYVTASIRDYLAGSDDELIKLEKCDINDGKVDIELLYATCADYAAYNDVVCFEGTLQEAEEAGFDLTGTYLTPEGGSISLDQITAGEGQIRVLIMNEVTSVDLPGTLLAYSDNAVLGENGILTTIPDTDESLPEEFRTINYNNSYFIYSVK